MKKPNIGFFTEENSIETVKDRHKDCENIRLKKIMDVMIEKIHEAVKEIEPTQEEWMQAIKFLTAVGHKSDDWRQEYILLSDIMGVSMLVDSINNRKPKGATESTVLGPFHVDDAPERKMGENICLDQKGDEVLVRGKVLDTEGNPIKAAKIDVWQANDDGFYDVQQKGIQPDFNLRGVFRTAEDGEYWFRAVKPVHYSIPDDGPVGELTRALGRHAWRPAHLHYIVSAEGYETLVTHIFDPNDPYIASDAVFGVKASLLCEYEKVDDQTQAKELDFKCPFLVSKADFVLVKSF